MTDTKIIFKYPLSMTYACFASRPDTIIHHSWIIVPGRPAKQAHMGWILHNSKRTSIDLNVIVLKKVAQNGLDRLFLGPVGAA